MAPFLKGQEPGVSFVISAFPPALKMCLSKSQQLSLGFYVLALVEYVAGVSFSLYLLLPLGFTTA